MFNCTAARVTTPVSATAGLLQQRHAIGPGYSEARASGQFDLAVVIAGESAGLVHHVRPAKEIVHELVRERHETFGSLPKGKQELAAQA